MRNPRLTKRVLNGLNSMACFIEAGACDDFMGYSEEALDADGLRTWEDVQKACNWITGMVQNRARKSSV